VSHPTVGGEGTRGDAVARLQSLLPAVDGEGPRVAPAHTDELRPLARLVAEVAARITGTGPPHIFTTLGRHPPLFRAWLRYSARLMLLGELPRRDTELAILRVAWRCRSAYQWQQHVPIALRAGLTPGEVAGAAEEHPATSLTERQRAVLAVSDELLARHSLSDTTWSAVQDAALDERETIELCLLVGHYQGLASAIGGLGIQVERARHAART
jgi:alkylhydroperoxidase family enzyme